MSDTYLDDDDLMMTYELNYQNEGARESRAMLYNLLNHTMSDVIELVWKQRLRLLVGGSPCPSTMS